MSRKTTNVQRQNVQQQKIDLEADKKARLQLVEARRKLTFNRQRSPSIKSIDGHGTRSPVPRQEVVKGEKTRRVSGASLTSSTSEFKWVNIDGKGNWQKVRLEKNDDFKDEDLAGAVSGEETDLYWNELNENREKREEHLIRMCTEFIDVPGIIIVSDEVSLEHTEKNSKCEVTTIEQDETVN